MEMKKLKVATTRMAGYTGVLGPVRFTDGLSDEYLPRHIRDRMAASMEFLEIDQDGAEQPAGAQYRLISDNAQRAPKLDDLQRQTDDEKIQELTKVALDENKAPILNTRDDLETIAEKSGIKGLREVGSKWGVKHRNIATLIEMILDAQEKAIAARNRALTEKIAAEAERLKSVSPMSSDEYEKAALKRAAEVNEEVETLLVAAEAGDLSAAINAETLLGSSILASTYQIGGETVQFGEIVRAAFDRLSATAAEWNALPEADREDLLRLELDQRLPQE